MGDSYSGMFPVDAANVCVIGPDTIKKYGIRSSKWLSKNSKIYSKVKVEKGETIYVSVYGCFNDSSSLGTIRITAPKKGNYYIGDFCYIVKRNEEFVKSTNLLKKMPKDCKSLLTRSDGLYHVSIEIW
jgi:hypothetical protein